jgi:Arc/MetJ-type ribon-helix-helix transcriptional regulator
MSTISVPLSPELQHLLDSLVANSGTNRAEVMRRALEWFAEEEAVNVVRKSEQEIADGKVLRGDTRTILLSK